jgi:3',5'-cyclic AMP phosphodiesterase CpdA
MIEQVGDLLVVGDWGSGTMPQGAVAGAMMRYAEQEEVEAVLTTGDNLYSDDFGFLMEPFGWADEDGIPFWVGWGNHDVESQTRIEAMNTVFDDPPRWTVHQWGAADVVILDSTQVDSDEQLSFLEESLAASQRPTIVVAHHPPFSCGEYDDSTQIIEDWLPLFDQDVVLVLSGHEHSYQRFQVDGVAYAVTGGGGATLSELGTCAEDHPELVAGESLHHFLVLSQDGDAVNVSSVDVNGDVFDEFSVELG